MSTFIITFPESDKARRDGWVRVINAKDLTQVVNYAKHEYKDEYSMIYEEAHFTEGYYPLGCLAEVDFRRWHDYVT